MQLLINDVMSTATLSTNPTTACYDELPINNAKLLSKSKIARSKTTPSGAGSLVITGNFVQASTISSFIIGQHNFSENVNYQLVLYNYPDLGGDPIIYSNEGNHDVTSAQAATDMDTFQYNIIIDIKDDNGDPLEVVSSFELTLLDNNSIDYFQIGRLMAGNAIDTNIGASFGHKIYWKENSKQYRTEIGTLRTDIVTSSKVIEFSLNTIYESERANLQRSLASIGKRDEFFISLFPEDCSESKEIAYSGIVKLIKIPKYSEFAQNFYSSKYAVEEI